MRQTKRESFVEAITNMLIGYSCGVLSQLLVFPLVGIYVSWSDNLLLALYFTLVSLLRNYVVRRVFDAKKHKKVYV
jgi:hypothetical protein